MQAYEAWEAEEEAAAVQLVKQKRTANRGKPKVC